MNKSNVPTDFKPKSIYPTIKEYAMITLGIFIMSCGWNWFLIPNEITGGGATGFSAIVYYATEIPVYITFFAVNLVLIVIAIIKLGWGFSLKTIFGAVMTTVALALNQINVRIDDPFMATVVGGLLNGIGLGIAFLNNGSTGGTDIIAKLVTAKRNITIGKVLLYIDVCIISSSYFLPDGSIEKIIYGFLTMAVTTLTVDIVINGVRQSVQFFIFSSEPEKIADAITTQLGRGVTVLDGQGWYSKEPVKVLTTLARKQESVKIFKIIKEIDPDAFVSQTSAIGVYGKGFDVIKTK